MVIHQFNRLIRNKWVWGVFAIAISAFFAFDFLFTGQGDERGAVVGTLGGKDVSNSRFQEIANEVRGMGIRRDNAMPSHEANRRTWERLAALAAAEEDHLMATDEEVREQILREPAFQENGQFSKLRYQQMMANMRFDPKQFETFLRHELSLSKLRGAVLGGASWASPMELDSEFYDWTDKFTVRIAAFVDKNADSVKLDDAGLEAYYKEHTNSIALPDCMTVRYVRFPADTAARLATFPVTDDEMHDFYDANMSRFETTGTNGVSVTKPFEEVKSILERELQLIASLDAYRTNILDRVYAPDLSETAATNMLSILAAEAKLAVKTTPRFTTENGKYVEGFMSRPSVFLPDCSEFLEEAATLDPEMADQRYGVAVGTNAVYLIERASFEKAHVPTFADAKEIIRPKALADARAKAFKASVDKQRALAAAELAKGKPFDAKFFAGANVSTSITFVAAQQTASFPNASTIIGPTLKLSKGNISEFLPTPMAGHGVVVYVEDRVPGDNLTSQEWVRMQVRSRLGDRTSATRWNDWCAWNLERIGFTALAGTSVEPVVNEDSVEEN